MRSLIITVVLLCIHSFAQSNLPLLGAGAGSGAAAISFTDVQHHVNSPASCANCANTLTQSIATGNILVVMANGYTNGVHPTAVTGQSGFVECPGLFNKGSSSTGFSSGGYVPSTTAQASPVNVTFNGATGSTTNIEIWEISVANGPASLDICGSISNPSNTTTQAGVTPTYSGSGTNEATMQYASTAAAVNSVANYTSRDCNTNGQCWGIQNNSKTTTAPSYTLSSAGITETGIIAFGKSTTPCQATVVVDFGGGTNGTQFTNTTLNNSTHQAHDITPWVVAGTVGFKADTASKTALVNSIRFCDDGSTYSDTSTLGAIHDQTTTDTLSYGFTQQPDNLSIGFYFTSTLPDNDNSGQQDTSSIRFAAGGTKIIPALIGNATALKLRVENTVDSSNTDCGTFGDFHANTRYWFTMQIIRNVSAKFAMYDATSTTLGAAICSVTTSTGPANSAIGNVEFGHVGVGAATANFKYSGLKISFDGTFPLLN